MRDGGRERLLGRVTRAVGVRMLARPSVSQSISQPSRQPREP